MANRYSTLSNLQKTSKLNVKSTILEHHETAHRFSKHHKNLGEKEIQHLNIILFLQFNNPPEFNPNKVR